ncbi:MAG: hypothetical protein R3D28_14880 [Geminicoccaceae bacterium]
MPLLLAGLGEQMSEKAGVLNIGIEGMMLMGAYLGFLVAFERATGRSASIAGMAGGMAVAFVMAILCVGLALNQIVIGIGLTLGVEGSPRSSTTLQFSTTHPRLPAAWRMPVPGLVELPVIGPRPLRPAPLVYLAFSCSCRSWPGSTGGRRSADLAGRREAGRSRCRRHRRRYRTLSRRALHRGHGRARRRLHGQCRGRHLHPS